MWANTIVEVLAVIAIATKQLIVRQWFPGLHQHAEEGRTPGLMSW
jgi:hypothetical protein